MQVSKWYHNGIKDAPKMNRGDKSLNSNYKNFVKAKAIEAENRKRWLKLNPNLNDNSGVYILRRVDEDGFKFGYAGQAKHILTRLCQHSAGHQQHIDLSLKKHGLYSENNPYGWTVICENFSEASLDRAEQFYIKWLADQGYQLRNKTGGSQGAGKKQIDEYRPAKGYYDGLKQGKKSLARELSYIIDTHLQVSLKPEKQNNKVSIRAFERFQNLIDEKTYE
jgi:hypothetical protein